jgi:hypothetical protein
VRAVSSTRLPEVSLTEIEITSGNRLAIGICDLLAAGEVWAALIDAAV